MSQFDWGLLTGMGVGCAIGAFMTAICSVAHHHLLLAEIARLRRVDRRRRLGLTG